jgi:cobalt/nickel transport system permease protein
VASPSESRRHRAVLVAWLCGVFALSAIRDLALLALAVAAVAVLLRRGLWRSLVRVLRSVVPVTAGLSLLSMAWLRAVAGAWPAVEPFLALAVRTVAIGLATFSVLDRVDLLQALAPYPTLSRLLVVTLAQIHALRLLATESLLGLRSRMARKPGAVDLVRGAGGITAALFTLSARNARDISDAMRSRGF